MKKVKNIWFRRLLILLGTLSLGLGIVGIFLPLLPTTPLLLLAAYLYSKSSNKFYHKLLENKYFGSYIKDFQEKRGISLKTKTVSIFTIWFAIILSIYFIDNFIIEILLVVIALSVSYYLLSLKTKE